MDLDYVFQIIIFQKSLASDKIPCYFFRGRPEYDFTDTIPENGFLLNEFKNI
jgi:hypothetical protein